MRVVNSQFERVVEINEVAVWRPYINQTGAIWLLSLIYVSSCVSLIWMVFFLRVLHFYFCKGL